MLMFIRRRWLLLLIIVAVALGGAFAAIRAMKPAPKTDVSPVTLEFVASDVTQAEPRSIAQRLPLSGTLQPRDLAIVKARVAGELRRALAREGESVRAGQLLAQVDSPDLTSRLADKQAALDGVRAQLAMAEKNRSTNQALMKQGFISQNAYDNVDAAASIQRESVKSAEAQLAMAKNALVDAQAKSPIDGIVARLHARSGEKVNADSPIYTIVNLRQMELQALLPASDIGAVRLGAPVRFNVDGFADRTFTGRVERINPTAEAGSRSITIYVSVSNPELVLRGGSFASGTLELAASTPRPTLPLTAIRSENGQNFVWVIRDGKLARKSVVLGRRDEEAGLVQVTEAIPGLPVVATRVDGLREGNPAVLKLPPVSVAAQSSPPSSATQPSKE